MGRPFSIIHLSDLHFGRIQTDVLKHLEEFLVQRKNEIRLAILTGDFTQRARQEEFLAAREFMSSLESPLFIVPGNHDVPLYNLFLRFFSPYKKFLKYLGPFAQNYYEDEALAVFGLWTVDNFAVQTGKLRKKDLEDIEERFRAVSKTKIRIVASHHPIFSIQDPHLDKDQKRLLDLSPHFLMWGHEHQSGIKTLNENKPFPLILASGTSTSSRLRSEANSFNYITFHDEGFDVEIFRHSKRLGGFEVIDCQRKALEL